MKKIASLFERNYSTDRLINQNVVLGSEWVIQGEGVATKKFDGTCCLVLNGLLYKRYDAKFGKNPPQGFIPAEEKPNEHTGHYPGWLFVGDSPDDKRHREARDYGGVFKDGTYELCGPKVQGNPEKFLVHCLIQHGINLITNAPRSYLGLKEYFLKNDIEGIVWHHADGRMVKIKGKDFGIKRGAN